MPDWGVALNDREFRTFLNTLATGAPVRTGLRAGALQFKGYMSEYPPVRRQPQPFHSDLQRRGFFAKLRSGEIVTPYPRGTAPNSETAGKRWVQEERDGGDTQVVGNNASYAKLLYSPVNQAFYHKGNWRTTEEQWERHKGDVQKAIFAAAVQAMRAAGTT